MGIVAWIVETLATRSCFGRKSRNTNDTRVGKGILHIQQVLSSLSLNYINCLPMNSSYQPFEMLNDNT